MLAAEIAFIKFLSNYLGVDAKAAQPVGREILFYLVVSAGILFIQFLSSYLELHANVAQPTD